MQGEGGGPNLVSPLFYCIKLRTVCKAVASAHHKSDDLGIDFKWGVHMNLVCRNGDHAPEDIVPACQLTLKNLQLEYLDLYLMHWPLAQKKGVKLADLTDEENYSYTEEGVAETWKV